MTATWDRARAIADAVLYEGAVTTLLAEAPQPAQPTPQPEEVR